MLGSGVCLAVWQLNSKQTVCCSALSTTAITSHRYDPGVLVSAFARYLPSLASGGTDAMKLTGPFSKVGFAEDLEFCPGTAAGLDF